MEPAFLKPRKRSDESVFKPLKEGLKSTLHRGRMLTAASRPLPDTVILGAMRAGTTFLRRMLVQHREVCPSRKKELHYFEYNYQRGERWYRAFFPTSNAANALRYLDCSPCYLFHPLVPARMQADLPDAKLLVLLRNPVERALSHYFHEVRRGREMLPLLEALQAEQQRLAGEEERICADPAYRGLTHRLFSYKARGLYAEQLTRWLPWIECGQLMVVQSEQLFESPREVMPEIFRFLGVDPDYPSLDVGAENIGWNRIEVAPEARAYLEDYFREPNLRCGNY